MQKHCSHCTKILGKLGDITCRKMTAKQVSSVLSLCLNVDSVADDVTPDVIYDLPRLKHLHIHNKFE